MINLIPPHARKQVKTEYWVRVVSVWFFILVAAMIAVAVLYIPAYVLIQSQISAYEETFQAAEQNDGSYKKIESVIEHTNAVAQHLLQGVQTQSFSAIIDELERLSGPAVAVEEISSERHVEGHIETVRVKGVAATREKLAAYRDALQGHYMFGKAELPISNLAKDREVPFTITLTMETNI